MWHRNGLESTDISAIKLKHLALKLGRNFRVFSISFWDGKVFETFTMETEIGTAFGWQLGGG